MIGRVVVTLVILAIWGWVQGFFDTVTPLVVGPAATWQFDNSDTSYIMSQYGMRFGSATHWLVDIAAIVALFFIWVGTVKRSLLTILVAMIIGFMFTPAYAYYASQDYAEYQMVLPNESAFLIPEVGANKDSQKEFGSVEYLKANKVPLKRLQIPHVRLESTGWFANQVVPAARLIVVDRAPYQREWTDNEQKGTSKKNEGFRCESKDSIAVTTAVTIAAYVTEEDAPQFLYHFGVQQPEGKRDDPNVIFSSVLHGRSLEQVMDTNVRGKVHSELCNQIGTRNLDDVFAQKTQIIQAVEKGVKATYQPMGISLEYIGFADELGYDKDIQHAINRVYITDKEAKAALNLQPAMPVLQQEADMDVKRGLAAGLSSKGLPNLPSFMLLNKDIFDMVGGWFKSDYSPATMGQAHK